MDPELTPAERRAVATAVAGANPAARAQLVAVSAQLAIVLATPTSCPRPHVSCVRAGGSAQSAGRPIVVALQRAHLAQAATPRGTFLILHELGHAIDAGMLDDEGRRAFEREFRQAAPGAVCLSGRHAADCLEVHELFADEFARWAGGYRRSLSAYATPALLPGDRFAQLLDRYAHPRRVGEFFGAWPDR
jgi:hypothetical protein